MERVVFKRHKKMLDRLLLMAEGVQTNANPYRLAASVVKKRKVLAYGINSYFKSHPLQARHAKHEEAVYPCAEAKALINAKRRHSENIEGSILYVARLKYTDQSRTKLTSGLAAPCKSCRKHIESFGISQIIYTTDTGFICEIVDV